jgi:uncharacterized membrane protein YhaH (DUF805 family)
MNMHRLDGSKTRWRFNPNSHWQTMSGAMPANYILSIFYIYLVIFLIPYLTLFNSRLMNTRHPNILIFCFLKRSDENDLIDVQTAGDQVQSIKMH